MKSGDVFFGNPASQHTSGKLARKKVNQVREHLYERFGKNEKDTNLIFHSGATEGFHTFAHSFVIWAQKENKKLLICYSEIDHPAVTSLAESFSGPDVSFYKLAVNEDLSYNFDTIFHELQNRKDTIILYHHLWVHNETGFVSPLENLIKLKSIPDLYIHVDGVQAPGKISEGMNLSVGDIWTFSAHKFGALKGLGFSFFQKTFPFHALIKGGGQQKGLRSGTENVSGIWSLHLALKDLENKNPEDVRRGRYLIEEELDSLIKGRGGILKKDESLRNSNTIYFYLNDLTSDISLAVFDLQGLELSAGSACSSGAAKDSAILLKMGKKAVAKNGLRLSLGFAVSESEIQSIIKKLKTTFARFNAHSNT